MGIDFLIDTTDYTKEYKQVIYFKWNSFINYNYCTHLKRRGELGFMEINFPQITKAWNSRLGIAASGVHCEGPHFTYYNFHKMGLPYKWAEYSTKYNFIKWFLTFKQRGKMCTTSF